MYSQAGNYDVSLTVTDAFGTSSQTINNLITYVDTTSIITNSNNYQEGFDTNIFPPEAWQTPVSSFSWGTMIVDTGINCYPNKVTYVDHYNISQRGDEAYLISNKVKLGSGITAVNYLIYDYAYSGFSGAHNDGFRIDISKDCGASWDSIYGAYGSNLQTTGYVTSIWHPTCGSWKTDSINLTNLGYNNDTIMVRFVAINDYGNLFYMDNVNIKGENILSNIFLQNEEDVYLFPNPSDGNFSIQTKINNLNYSILNSLGKTVRSGTISSKISQIKASDLDSGVYLIIFNNSKKTFTRKLVIN